MILQYGETALHLAYKWGSTRVQQLLIDNGADQSVFNKVSNYNYVIIIIEIICEIVERRKTSRCGISEV